MKVLFDTNVLVELFRNPHQRERFELRAHRPLMFMSSVVVMELLAGFLKPFEKANRIVTPDHACFREAGRVLAGLGRKHTAVRWMKPELSGD